MNALVYNVTHHTTCPTINKMCQLVTDRQFQEAEQSLVTCINGLVNQGYHSRNQIQRMLTLLEILYTEFNSYYLQWAKKHGKNEISEIEELSNKMHPNFLIANCTDPESMDDLLYEVRNYLMNLSNKEQEKEARHHLTCYQKQLAHA